MRMLFCAVLLLPSLALAQPERNPPVVDSECQRAAVRKCTTSVVVSGVVLGAVGMAKGAVTAVAARGPVPKVVIPAAIAGALTGAAAGATAAVVTTCSRATGCGEGSE